MLLRKEVTLLPRQLFRFENLKEDSNAFQFNSGLTVRAWDALWTILKPSPENVLSAKSAATEADGRLHCHGQGWKPTLDLEDELAHSDAPSFGLAGAGSWLTVWSVTVSGITNFGQVAEFSLFATWLSSYLA